MNNQKINTVTNSKKDLKMIPILDSSLYQPDETLKRNVHMNPFVAPKTETLEKIKEQQYKLRTTMQS